MNEEPLVENRLLNYIWVYKDKQRKREKRLYSDYFHPNINRGAYSSRVIGSQSNLPIKKNFRTKTEVWLKNEKQKLQKEIEKSVSAYKGKKPEIKPEDVEYIQAQIKSEKNLMGRFINLLTLKPLLLLKFTTTSP